MRELYLSPSSGPSKWELYFSPSSGENCISLLVLVHRSSIVEIHGGSRDTKDVRDLNVPEVGNGDEYDGEGIVKPVTNVIFPYKWISEDIHGPKIQQIVVSIYKHSCHPFPLNL